MKALDLMHLSMAMHDRLKNIAPPDYAMTMCVDPKVGTRVKPVVLYVSDSFTTVFTKIADHVKEVENETFN